MNWEEGNLKQTPKPNGKTPEERVRKCAELFQAALKETGCQVYTALRVGNAETPLVEIAGLPIVVKIATDDTQA